MIKVLLYITVFANELFSQMPYRFKRYLFSFSALWLVVNCVAQPIKKGIYSNQNKKQLSALCLEIGDSNLYSIYLDVGRDDHIIMEYLSEGTYTEKSDTVILYDHYLNCAFKFLNQKNSLRPIAFFTSSNKSDFHFVINVSKKRNETSAEVRYPSRQQPKEISDIKNIEGVYIDSFALVTKQNRSYYAEYLHKIIINPNSTFEYWIGDYLVSIGKWSIKNNLLLFKDYSLENPFSTFMDDLGYLKPNKWPGNFWEHHLFVLKKYRHEIKLIKNNSTTELLIPDEF